MSKTIAIVIAPASSVFSRLIAVIDRVLIASACVAVRNGDLARFGL